MTSSEFHKGLAKLLETIRKLRDPDGGCPWDLKQTHKSLLPYLLEESHEFIEAIEKHAPDSQECVEELGDVLLQVVLHAQILSESSQIDFDLIAERAAEKIILRHPHVFEPGRPKESWEQTKQRLKPALERLLPPLKTPPGLPALQRASRVGEKAASLGFDFETEAEVLLKIEEELHELKNSDSPSTRSEECGDLLFATAQWARKAGFDPEALLRGATRKFESRFEQLSQRLKSRGLNLNTLSQEQIEAEWQAVKVDMGLKN